MIWACLSVCLSVCWLVDCCYNNPVRGVKCHLTSLRRRSSSVQPVQQTPQPRHPLRSRKTIAVLHWRDTLGGVCVCVVDLPQH